MKLSTALVDHWFFNKLVSFSQGQTEAFMLVSNAINTNRSQSFEYKRQADRVLLSRGKNSGFKVTSSQNVTESQIFDTLKNLRDSKR